MAVPTHRVNSQDEHSQQVSSQPFMPHWVVAVLTFPHNADTVSERLAGQRSSHRPARTQTGRV